LFDDPHLQATGGLADVMLTDGPKAGQNAKAALLPFTMDGQRLGIRRHPPRQGQDTHALLVELGLTDHEVQRLRQARAVA
jgi:crotonobetainyl-CoA:carnitine CoA-transferase CaiB-like acyl-CoA transferase